MIYRFQYIEYIIYCVARSKLARVTCYIYYLM